LADSIVRSTGRVESAGSSSHNISNVFAMVRISWVNVWTRSRSWSGFIAYLFSLRFWGLSGLSLPTSIQVSLEIFKDIVRHRRPPRCDKRRRSGSEIEIGKIRRHKTVRGDTIARISC
jgi:hypothetical protein